LQAPTRIAWTVTTLAQIAGGQPDHGAFVALNYAACHGDQGVSQSSLFPTLAGMDAAVIYKQLDDFRAIWRVRRSTNPRLSFRPSGDLRSFGLLRSFRPLNRPTEFGTAEPRHQ
jgi:mono/diheme cytochrome c family protein